MKLSTQSLARASAAHPWRTCAAWGVTLAAAVAAVVLLLGGALTSDVGVATETESGRGYELLERVPDRAEFDDVVVVRSEQHTVGDDEAFSSFVDRLAERLRAEGGVLRTQTYLDVNDITPFVSPDRHATIVPVLLGAGGDEKIEDVLAVVDDMDRDAAFAVSVTGEWTLDHDFLELSQHDLKEGELFFGLPAALIILLLVFGAVVAGLVPILMALVSILIALGLTALVGQAFELSLFVVNMLSGMGLALGIDYSLFVLSRYREERGRGLEKLAAIEASGATASRAVAFSGMAYVVALLGMLLVPDTVLRSLAVGAILVGIVSVLAALTLLPAVLGLLGDRVNAVRIPVLGRGAVASAGREGRVWSSIARGVMRRPVVSLVVAGGLLLAAAVPVLDLNTGSAGVSTIPDGYHSKQGFLALESDFHGGLTDPVRIVFEGEDGTATVSRAQDALRADDVFGPSRVETSGDVAVVTAAVRGDVNSERAYAAVRELRADLEGTGALVTGQTAENVDYFDVIDRWLPIVFAFVLALSFLLLTAVFRSLVIALKAILLNLLSVGAAYGLLVLVFQKGVGNELLGLNRAETVEAWVPLFLFSVLFGLSMDYHVFLLTRIRERYLETGDNDGAVAYGIGSTARLITGAALIIVAVFTGFAMGDLVMFQQMGFGVAIALLLDATIIRSVLVPASMKLLGRWNWYLPSWLEWLPELHVEGTDERHERRPAPAPGY